MIENFNKVIYLISLNKFEYKFIYKYKIDEFF